MPIHIIKLFHHLEDLILKKSLIALSLCLGLSDVRAADVEKMRKQLNDRMPGTQIGAITKSPYAGLYEVVANGFNVFYTDENADIAIIGKMIDLKTTKDLAQERTRELMHVDFASLPLDKAVVKVKGDSSRKFAVFSDPDCPFCHELEKELAKVNDVTIYIFLYPLSELHPDAERKAKLVWCAAHPARAWDELMLGGREPAVRNEPCEPPLKEIRAFAQKNWITGTPGLIFADGQLVAGSVNSAQIENFLAKPTQDTSSVKRQSAAGVTFQDAM